MSKSAERFIATLIRAVQCSNSDVSYVAGKALEYYTIREILEAEEKNRGNIIKWQN
jgi:hypothetical protein